MGFGSGYNPSRTEVNASTKAGGASDDTHQFTGSVEITGSLSVNGVEITGSGGGGGGGSPGGSDTQIQYNNGGSAFGGISAFTWDDTDLKVNDDTKLKFGTNSDSHIEYDEAATDALIISGSKTTGLVLSGSKVIIGSPNTAYDTPAGGGLHILSEYDAGLSALGINGVAIEVGQNNLAGSQADNGKRAVAYWGAGQGYASVWDPTNVGTYWLEGIHAGITNGSFVYSGEISASCGIWIGQEVTGSRVGIPGLPANTSMFGDDHTVYFGTGKESHIKYRETSDNFMVISGSTAGGLVLSGSQLVLDTGMATSGSIAGPGSYLGLGAGGKVVLTASSGGGGGGGSPGGSTTQIQYNDGGAFAGATNIIYKNSAATPDGTLLKITGSTHFQRGVNFGNMPNFQVGGPPNDTALNQHAIYITESTYGGHQVLGISNDDPHWQGGGFDSVHDFSSWPGGTPSNMPDTERGGGHRLRYGLNICEEGILYYLSGATSAPFDKWHTASATISNSAPHMLALGMGGPGGEVPGSGLSASAAPGLVLEGYFNIPSAQVRNMPTTNGSTVGVPLYVSNFAGKIDFNAPTGSGEFVRVIGYAMGDDYKSGDLLIRFNPDCTWVAIT